MQPGPCCWGSPAYPSKGLQGREPAEAGGTRRRVPQGWNLHAGGCSAGAATGALGAHQAGISKESDSARDCKAKVSLQSLGPGIRLTNSLQRPQQQGAAGSQHGQWVISVVSSPLPSPAPHGLHYQNIFCLLQYGQSGSLKKIT